MTYRGISVADKVTVVVGGTSGIGKAIALGMAREGALVVPTSRTAARVEVTVAEIEQAGGRSLVCPVDTTDEAQLRTLRERVLDAFGRIDVLVNSAGTHIKKPSVEMTAEEWGHVIDVNLTGPFLACKVIGETMIAQEKGKIVNVASMGSFVGLLEAAAYCASKGGVVQLTRALAQEWAPHNVAVNAIAPGFFLTPLNRDILTEGSARRKRIEDSTPMGRLGDVDDLVGAVVYLASDAADFVTGATLTVDGGFLAAGI